MKISCVAILAASCLMARALSGAEEPPKPPKTADEVLTAYMAAVQEEVGKDPRALGQEGVIAKFQELGEKHLLANKKVLHEKAAKDYMKLDELSHIRLEAQRRLAWKQKAEYADGKGVVKVPGAEDKVGTILVMFIEEGYGIPPFDKNAFATTWWDPMVAARIIRDLSLRHLLSREEAQKRQFVEQYTPPRVYRVSKDAEDPSIAFFDGKEIFVVDLKYSSTIGIYCLAGLRWVEVKNESR